MNRFCFILAFLVLSFISFGQDIQSSNQMIIKFKDDVSLPKSEFPQKQIGNPAIDNLNFKYNFLEIKHIPAGKSNQTIFAIQFPETLDISGIIDEYVSTGVLEYAEPDFIGSGAGIQSTIPNDQFFFRQWGLKNDGTFTLSTALSGADIEMYNAWDIEQGDSNIIVAIIDSGTQYDHPEFAGRIWRNQNEIPDNGVDDDLNGYIDDIRGWDFAYSDNDPKDDNGHGTNVAGIVGANGNNSFGYAGVDWNCKLMILKALGSDNNGLYSWWSAAIYYAVDNGAHVINMSMGGSGNSLTLKNAIDYATANNVVVVASMMNFNSSIVYYPAGFPGVIAVGSTNPDDTRSNPFFWSTTSGSSYGDHISVSAPGNFIYGLNHTSNANYGSYWGGTSQAAPHVAGLASLLLAQDPERSPSEIQYIIESSAIDQVGKSAEDIAGWDPYHGFGRINAFRALTFINTSNSETETASELQINVYPNPFSAIIYVDQNNLQLRSAHAELYSARGVLCVNKELNQKGEFPVADLLPGAYVLLIKDDNGEVIHSRQLIKK